MSNKTTPSSVVPLAHLHVLSSTHWHAHVSWASAKTSSRSECFASCVLWRNATLSKGTASSLPVIQTVVTSSNHRNLVPLKFLWGSSVPNGVRFLCFPILYFTHAFLSYFYIFSIPLFLKPVFQSGPYLLETLVWNSIRGFRLLAKWEA